MLIIINYINVLKLYTLPVLCQYAASTLPAPQHSQGTAKVLPWYCLATALPLPCLWVGTDLAQGRHRVGTKRALPPLSEGDVTELLCLSAFIVDCLYGVLQFILFHFLCARGQRISSQKHTAQRYTCKQHTLHTNTKVRRFSGLAKKNCTFYIFNIPPHIKNSDPNHRHRCHYPCITLRETSKYFYGTQHPRRQRRDWRGLGRGYFFL